MKQLMSIRIKPEDHDVVESIRLRWKRSKSETAAMLIADSPEFLAERERMESATVKTE